MIEEEHSFLSSLSFSLSLSLSLPLSLLPYLVHDLLDISISALTCTLSFPCILHPALKDSENASEQEVMEKTNNEKKRSATLYAH